MAKNKYKNSTLFGVAGNPILHSQSPEMFNRAFSLYGVKACYTRISAESAEEVIGIMKTAGFAGINITAPFKGDIMQFIDEPAPIAGFIKSANVVYWAGARLLGDNTDYLGVLGALQKNGLYPAGKKCLVLGTGFAARAAVFAITFNGGAATVCGRNFEKAKGIASEFNCSAMRIEELQKTAGSYDIIVNALPAGIQLLKKEWLNDKVTLFDANYNKSEMKKLAVEADCGYIDGRLWLIAQALPVFNLFSGKECDRRIFLSASMEKKINSNRLLYLTGFMGSGKTSAGKALADKLGYDFADMDSLIAEQEGKTIAEIFESQGEQRFRQLESAMLKHLSERKKCVISTGGGIAEDEENIALMKETGMPVWLHSSLDVCLQRITGDDTGLKSRPLAAELGLDKLYAERLPFYCAVSDLLVNSEKSIDKITGRILEEFKAVGFISET